MKLPGNLCLHDRLIALGQLGEEIVKIVKVEMAEHARYTDYPEFLLSPLGVGVGTAHCGRL